MANCSWLFVNSGLLLENELAKQHLKKEGIFLECKVGCDVRVMIESGLLSQFKPS